MMGGRAARISSYLVGANHACVHFWRKKNTNVTVGVSVTIARARHQRKWQCTTSFQSHAFVLCWVQQSYIDSYTHNRFMCTLQAGEGACGVYSCVTVCNQRASHSRDVTPLCGCSVKQRLAKRVVLCRVHSVGCETTPRCSDGLCVPDVNADVTAVSTQAAMAISGPYTNHEQQHMTAVCTRWPHTGLFTTH